MIFSTGFRTLSVPVHPTMALATVLQSVPSWEDLALELALPAMESVASVSWQFSYIYEIPLPKWYCLSGTA